MYIVPIIDKNIDKKINFKNVCSRQKIYLQFH